MATIHHATKARAERMGFQIVERGEKFALTQDNGQTTMQSWGSAKEALDAVDAGDATWTEVVSPDSVKTTSGVMALTFHKRYTENGGGNGDALDSELREAFCMEDGKVDTNRLREYGEQLGLWNPRWEGLNPGMLRMNLANRIRGVLRNSTGEIAGPGGLLSRFGIEFRPSKKAKKVKKARKARKAKKGG